MDSAGGLIMSEHLIRIQLSANPRYCLKAHTHAPAGSTKTHGGGDGRKPIAVSFGAESGRITGSKSNLIEWDLNLDT